jgi:hypothetical protein
MFCLLNLALKIWDSSLQSGNAIWRFLYLVLSTHSFTSPTWFRNAHFTFFGSCHALMFLLTCFRKKILLFCPNFGHNYNVRLQVKYIVSEKCQNKDWNHKWKLPTTFNVWLCKILPFHIYVFHCFHNMLYMKSIHNFVVCVISIIHCWIFNYFLMSKQYIYG